jgi:hypothetical protein
MKFKPLPDAKSVQSHFGHPARTALYDKDAFRGMAGYYYLATQVN